VTSLGALHIPNIGRLTSFRASRLVAKLSISLIDRWPDIGTTQELARYFIAWICQRSCPDYPKVASTKPSGRTVARAEYWPDRNVGQLHERPWRGDHLAGCSLPSSYCLSVPFFHRKAHRATSCHNDERRGCLWDPAADMSWTGAAIASTAKDAAAALK